MSRIIEMDNRDGPTPQLEVAPQIAPNIPNTRIQRTLGQRSFSIFTKAWHQTTQFFSKEANTILPRSQQDIGKKQIEDFRPGYPRFTALIGAHPPFNISRRFSQLRSRLLLLKQDELSILEAKLEAVDEEETKELYLGNHRRDKNPVRRQILVDIDDALKEYDELVDRNHRMLNYESPQPRDTVSLRNWIENTACLARDETAYLGSDEDLLCMATQSDSLLVRLELLLERLLIFWCECVGRRPHLPLSRDPNAYIFSGTFFKRLTRAAAAWGVVLFLLVPVVIINALESTLLRLVLITVATAVVIILLAVLAKARTGEMFMAGATYATVLVVFVAGTGTGSPIG